MAINFDPASAINSKNNLLKANKQKNSALEKLSSGLRINKGSDDPSGLLISELLRSQISGYQRALRNTQETNNAMSIAEGGLSSVSSMLTNMRGLAIHALNSGITTGSQTYADQMEMNSLLSSINRVVSTTNYAGNNLLNGNRDFTFETSDPSGMLSASATSISNISGNVPSEIAVSYSGDPAMQAEMAYPEADFGDAQLAATQEFTVTGNDGSRTFSFAQGTTIEQMAEQINNSASSTGVNAYAVRDQGSGATMLRLTSDTYGSEAMVKVDQISGDGFARQGTTAVDYGQDATVNINGSSVTTNGLTANMANGTITGKFTFQAGDPNATTIAQTGYDQDYLTDAATNRAASLTGVKGGMQLQLGEGSGSQNRENVSLGNYSGSTLGTVEYNGERYSINDLYGGGAASLDRNPELALKIIDQAISDVASGRANIGAYQANSLDTNANNLMVAIENTMATESGIRDADMAEMMTMFIKNQLLEKAALKGVQSANMNAQNVAQLLGGLGGGR